MGPNNTPEQPPKKNMQEEARQAAEQIVIEIRASYNDRYAAINQISDQEERMQKRAQLDREIANEYRSKVQKQLAKDTSESGQADKPEDVAEKAKNAKKIFLEAKELGDKGTNVVDRKSQLIVDKIVEKIKSGEITDEGVLAIERNLGKQLLEGVVFSKQGEQLSSTEQGLKNLLEIDPQTAGQILSNIASNPETYGTTIDNLRQKLGEGLQGNDNEQQQEQSMEMLSEKAFEGDFVQYYRSRFTDEQIELISTFYSPEAFVGYMERLSNGGDNGGKNFLKKEQVRDRKEQIEHHVKEYYEKNHKPISDMVLKEQVEKHWGEEVSEMMNWQVSDVVNQLFLELQQKSPHKFYEQIMQEDIFQGPGMIQKRIQAAINSLMTKIDKIEGTDSDLAKRIDNLHLYRHAAQDKYIEERGSNKNIYFRLKPLPYGEKIGLTEFIKHINTTIEHTIHKTEYFHNSRAIFGHPPGKDGFYHQLGEFAEQMRGTDMDEIMLLPDGQYIMQAYQLYEKMLQEDFAQMDHRHRPDQLSNKLERVNSEIEIEVIEQFQKFYPDLSQERIKNIVNSAVGVSRGMFLTEAEQSAYADPVDSEGRGMVASYSTNDAGSLNVFNPMHTILRWQGEHNFNSMYFMPIDGQPGKMWDHNKAWNNMAKYMDSFLVGHGRGKGKNGLPEEVFADSLMDIGKVGGPGKRKGWRMKHSLEGHFKYDPDGTINAPQTFRAMEAIGYEALANFVNNNQAGNDLLKATEQTDPGQVNERRELFKYIYKRYFSEDPSKFQESDLDSYMKKLQIKGEKKALDMIKKNGTGSISGSWEEQVAYETSQLFMENTLAHYVAAKFPTKFLRIDKNRLHDDGVGHWEQVWRELKAKGWERGHFDKVMKDMTVAEMLLRRQISEKIRENIKFDKDWTLDRINEIEDLPFRLNEAKIRELLSKNYSENGDLKDRTFKSEGEISDVIELYRHIKQSFIKKDSSGMEFLDDEGIKRIKDFTFTFGLEDTDVSLMAFRGTGPRMVARAIKDTGTIETEVIPWIIQMPLVLNELAINGKHDFSPIIEYMRKAQRAITDVNGVADTYEHMYKIAGTVINYFKKDAIAKPLFGLFGLGRKNSIAAEYAGRSGAVWEWDSRDIDRFCVSLESFGLLKNSPYDLQSFKGGKFTGGQLEDRWIKIPGLKKPIKFGKKRHIDYEYNSLKLRKEHGADWKAMAWDTINQLLPIAMAFVLWEYIKKSLEETEGKKK